MDKREESIREEASRGLVNFPDFEATGEYKPLSARIAELERTAADADSGI